jgi:hypothetical protein
MCIRTVIAVSLNLSLIEIESVSDDAQNLDLSKSLI